MKKYIMILCVCIFASSAYSQQGYTRSEVDMMLQLQQKELESKLNTWQTERDKSYINLQQQNKQLLETQDRVTNLLRFATGIFVLSIGISLFITLRSNKSRRTKDHREWEAMREETALKIEHITTVAQLIAEKAQLLTEKSIVQVENLRNELQIYLDELNTYRGSFGNNMEQEGGDA